MCAYLLSRAFLSRSLPVCRCVWKVFLCFYFLLVMQPSAQTSHSATNTGSAIQHLSLQGVDAALEEGAKLATQQSDTHWNPSTSSISIFTLFLKLTCSFTHTVQAFSSSFSLFLHLMGLFYKGPSYKLSQARDVNYRTMMEPLLHYA